MTEKMLTGTLRIKSNKSSSNILNKMCMRIYRAKMSQDHYFNGSPDTRPIITTLIVWCSTGKYSRSTVTVTSNEETYNWLLEPSYDSDRYEPSLIRIFAAHMKKAFIHRYLERTQACLNKLGRYTG